MSNSIYASTVLSIADLVRSATKNLQAKVNSGNPKEMPPIPSLEMVRLQFVPNNDTVEKSAMFSGRLGVRRAVQTRTLRKEHIDQHWVNSMVCMCTIYTILVYL